MNEITVNWLLEDKNPAVKYRTQTELLGQAADNADAKEWILHKLPENWHVTKGLWLVYYFTALAECGVKCSDLEPVHLEKAFDVLDSGFETSCADFMLLRALVKLGFGETETVRKAIEKAGENMLPDNGFICLHRLPKYNYIPKSCYKADLHALMLAAECKKNAVMCPFTNKLLEYFWNHNIYYRTDDKNTLVLNARPGWRTIDTFFPFEVMRVGIQNVVEALAALGYGEDEQLNASWDILDNHKDENGKVLLDTTLTKPYLPKERIGKPSKWVTFYTLLAEKERDLYKRQADI